MIVPGEICAPVPARILVTGSRRWSDRHTVEVAIRHEALRLGGLGRSVTVVHGGAHTGADVCAAVSAEAMDLRVEEHRADWRAPCRPDCQPDHRKPKGSPGRDFCPAAGCYRNQHMVDLGADICLAFPLPGSRGTWDCVERAKAAGIPVRVIEDSRRARE